MRLMRTEYAWIEQILSFASEDDKKKWLEKRNQKLDRRMFEPVVIIKEWKEKDRYFIRIRVPYNNANMLEGEYVQF